MNSAYKIRQEFTEDRLHLLGLLTDQAAIAIMNARFHDMVRHQAITDTLTGLPNRRAFDARLDEEIRRSSRYHHPFSLLMIDLDRFKIVNDTFGHPAGDRTLQVVANCLQKAVRDTDFIARYGGDEFTMILPETKKSQAEVLKAKIKEALSHCKMPWENGGYTLTITLSVGISCYPDEAKNAEKLIAIADEDLYSNKNRDKPVETG
jgi:diguanylate cyclase (GGDEF)-like protein